MRNSELCQLLTHVSLAGLRFLCLEITFLESSASAHFAITQPGLLDKKEKPPNFMSAEHVNRLKLKPHSVLTLHVLGLICLESKLPTWSLAALLEPGKPIGHLPAAVCMQMHCSPR